MLVDQLMYLHQYQNSTMLTEEDYYYDHAYYVNQVEFPADIPLTLLVAKTTEDIERETIEGEEVAEVETGLSMQQAWVEQSERGYLEELVGGHYLHHYEAERILQAIQEMDG